MQKENASSFLNRFKWIGISFLVVFSLLFLGGFHVGPLSARITVAFGLLIYGLAAKKSDYMQTKGMKMYYIYIAAYILVNIFSFSFFGVDFIKNLFAVHLICCIVIFVFPKIFKSEESIHGAYLVIVFGFLLNAIVTILQARGISLGWSLGMAINPTEAEEMYELQAKIDNDEDIKKAVVMGIMGRAVGNGYFMATFLPVVTYYFWDKPFFKHVWSFFVMVITFVCVYFIQQRMALVVVAAYLLCLVLLKERSLLVKVFLGMICLLVLIVSLESILSFDYTRSGRLYDFSDDIRSSTFYVFNEFISNPINLFFGSNHIYNEEEHQVFLVLGHNTFLDTIRMGGLFLLIPYLILFYCVCKTIFKIFFFSRKVKDYRTMGMAIGCFCFLLYSQTHSTGIQSGSIMFWTLYMLCVQSHRVKCEQTNNGVELIRWLQ